MTKLGEPAVLLKLVVVHHAWPGEVYTDGEIMLMLNHEYSPLSQWMMNTHGT